MKITKDFFDKLREEVRNSPACNSSERKTLPLDDVVKSINSYGEKHYDAFLKQIDWFAIDPLELIPREKVRAFSKRILGDERRLQLLKFLRKYEDYYFNDIITERNVYSISQFHNELTVLIEQIESAGEFSMGKINQLNAEIASLKTDIQQIEKEKKELIAELNALKQSFSTLQNQPHPHQLPCLDDVCNYAKGLSREEVKTIQNMLFSLMDITNKDIKSKITSIKSESTSPIVALGDHVENKYVK